MTAPNEWRRTAASAQSRWWLTMTTSASAASLPHPRHEAVGVSRALAAEAVLRGGRDVVPERQVLRQVGQLGAVARLGARRPVLDEGHRDARLVVARPIVEAHQLEAVQAQVVAAALHARGRERAQRTLQQRHVLVDQICSWRFLVPVETSTRRPTESPAPGRRGSCRCPSRPRRAGRRRRVTVRATASAICCWLSRGSKPSRTRGQRALGAEDAPDAVDQAGGGYSGNSGTGFPPRP